MNKPLVRVTNKNREGATVESLDGRLQFKYSWEDFNANFVATEEKHIYEMIINEELASEVDAFVNRQKWLTKYVFTILRVMAKKERSENLTLSEMGDFGHIVSEYQKEFKLSPAHFIEDIKRMKEMLQQGVMAK